MSLRKARVITYAIPINKTTKQPKILVLAESFAEYSAVATVLDGLFAECNPSCVTFVCRKGARTGIKFPTIKILNLIPTFGFRIGCLLNTMVIPFYFARIITYIKRNKVSKLLCINPSKEFLLMCLILKHITNIKFYTYFHDTLSETIPVGLVKNLYVKIESYSVRKASKNFTISDGLTEYLSKKHGIMFYTINHPYISASKKRNKITKQYQSTVLFSGQIYKINRASVIRVLKIAVKSGVNVCFTSEKAAKLALIDGVPEKSISYKFLPDRNDYLNELKRYYLHISALNWFDEVVWSGRKDTPVDFQHELSTIFPTKIPEYLASGVPCLVHCPEHYFLSQFFLSNKCGYVVNSRDEVSILKVFDEVNQSIGKYEILKNMSTTLNYFSNHTVSRKLLTNLGITCE